MNFNSRGLYLGTIGEWLDSLHLDSTVVTEVRVAPANMRPFQVTVFHALPGRALDKLTAGGEWSDPYVCRAMIDIPQGPFTPGVEIEVLTFLDTPEPELELADEDFADLDLA